MPLAGWAVTPESERLMHRVIPRTGERLPVVGLSTSRVFDVGMNEKFRGPVREVLRLLAQTPNSLVDTPLPPIVQHGGNIVSQFSGLMTYLQ